MKNAFLRGVDLSAAFWAGLIAGTVFLITMLLLSTNVLGSSDIVYRMIAAILRGEAVLSPTVAVDGGLIGSALVVHYALSLAFGLVVAVAIHRWGLIVGLFAPLLACCHSDQHIYFRVKILYFSPRFLSI